MNVLITAAGGGVGQALIKCLTFQGIKVIAVDPYEHAAGFYMPGVAARSRVPLATDTGAYLADIRRICEQEAIDLVFPGCDPELLPLSQLGSFMLPDKLCRVMVSAETVVRLAQDKFLSMVASELPSMAQTVRLRSYSDLFAFDLPCVVKPRQGSNSEGVQVLRTSVEAANWYQLYRNEPEPRREFVIQEYLEGPEYTCTAVVGLGGEVLDCLTLWREPRLGPRQNFIRRQCVAMPELEAITRCIVERCNMLSPAHKHAVIGGINVQARVVPDRGPVVFEINPRFPGSTAICARFGMNGPLMLARTIVEGMRVKGFLGPVSYGWTCYRALTEFYATPEESEPPPFVAHSSRP